MFVAVDRGRGGPQKSTGIRDGAIPLTRASRAGFLSSLLIPTRSSLFPSSPCRPAAHLSDRRRGSGGGRPPSTPCRKAGALTSLLHASVGRPAPSYLVRGEPRALLHASEWSPAPPPRAVVSSRLLLVPVSFLLLGCRISGSFAQGKQTLELRICFVSFVNFFTLDVKE